MFLTPYFIFLIIFAGFETLAAKPQWIAVVAAVSFVSSLAVVLRAASKEAGPGSFFPGKDWKGWSLLSAFAAFAASGILFFAFIRGGAARHAFTLLSAGASFMVVRKAFPFASFEAKGKEEEKGVPEDRPEETKNIVACLNLASAFMLYSGLAGLSAFLNFPAWPLSILAGMASFGLSWQMLRAYGLGMAKGRRLAYAAGIAIGAAEFFLASALLPASIFVKGMVVSVAHYLAAEAACCYLSKRFRLKEAVRWSLAMGGAAMAIVLATARWL